MNRENGSAGNGIFAVAVLGASAKPERYSYKAVAMLKDQGYHVFPVHPALRELQGLPVLRRISDIPERLDTITVYLAPERSASLREDMLGLKPRRVIFNPGAENPGLAAELREAGIEVVNACTLVMLTTGQFEPPKTLEPLRACAECIPCFLRQAREAMAMAGTLPENAEIWYGEISALVSAESLGANPPVVSQKIQRLIRERTGCADPYRCLKEDLNRAALEMLPELITRIPEGMSKPEAAVRLAIGGNILDAGAKSGLQLTEASPALERAFRQPLEGDWQGLFARTEKAQRILYLADNAGEIVFDRHLIRLLPAGKVTVAVRGGPVINDATLEDAQAAGICDLAAVIANGSDAPGTVLEDCSAEFREIFAKSDLVIAKGQGNYETLCSSDKPIIFLFQVKCPVIAARTGAAVGTLMIDSGKIAVSAENGGDRDD